MKVKEIVYEDGSLPGQGVAGKVTKVNQPMGDKPGSVDVTMPNGITSEIPSNMVTKGPDGKPMANTQTANTANATSPDQQIQPGTDIKVQEEPANTTNTIFVKRGPNGLIASDGDPIKVTNTGREVDQAYISDPVNATNRLGYINFNGNKIPALNTGHEWKVGPKVFQMISAPTAPVRESEDDQLLKSMLVIAGLK
jgi:hypothetical protein